MASVGFRWLDILEKEFDKAFVDLDLALGEIESDEPNVVFNVRQKLCTLGSCFAQLTHKAQTIFQNSAKIEAELIHLRAELVESKAKNHLLENELHNILLQLHSSQLSHLPDSLSNKKVDSHFKPDVSAIKKRLEAELRQSPLRIIKRSVSSDPKEKDEFKFSSNSLEPVQWKTENAQLLSENAALRNDVLALTSEVYGAKLAAKYLDKELAGRIQQLQLLGREMRGDVRDKLWRQLESEILLQRHKTVVRACRRSSTLNGQDRFSKPMLDNTNGGLNNFGDIRVVVVKRKPEQGLGISITGGREHGVPILISELEPNGPAAISEQLYIGDAILSVNDIDLRNVCHKEAVGILQQQTGDCVFHVQYIAADDSDNSLEEDGFNFRFFNDEVSSANHANEIKGSQANTPTAPRTPDSQPVSRLSQTTPEHTNLNAATNNGTVQPIKKIDEISTNNTNNNQLDNITKFSDDLTTVDTMDLILLDNSTNNIINLGEFKKVDVLPDIESNFNCSVNSLNSNMSSPMQTSTDVYLDSEVLSTDVTSNDSQSPKVIQTDAVKTAASFSYDNCIKNSVSIQSLSNPKSDQSLLNSDDSSSGSPVHKLNKHYKKQKKVKKKYFGVKTLQSIFNRQGYSDISTTASEIGDEQSLHCEENTTEASNNKPTYTDTSPQFEENVHSILSDIFLKSNIEPASLTKFSRQIQSSKKYFSMHGHNLRVSKAIRLCPNENLPENDDADQRKDKLLARYVYNANSVNVDGVGDPDFGTPV
ncbi:Golgi-associated PDZ and coiled-coil motif-containing protein-like [Cylas formicarius]|uniref:Golgi-associated PDZ and coiled-coil motif-containing protein-like n=1 Tax=Cylas formicarius TaxID=197179 RepID=UPI0029583F90|nr:Golgi-associated PDZ and coiled-coil motif-containing protein-like [Cylas formicarius]